MDPTPKAATHGPSHRENLANSSSRSRTANYHGRRHSISPPQTDEGGLQLRSHRISGARRGSVTSWTHSDGAGDEEDDDEDEDDFGTAPGGENDFLVTIGDFDQDGEGGSASGAVGHSRPRRGHRSRRSAAQRRRRRYRVELNRRSSEALSTALRAARSWTLSQDEDAEASGMASAVHHMLTVSELSALLGEIGASLTGISPDRAMQLASGGEEGESEGDDDDGKQESRMFQRRQRTRGIPSTTRLQRMALGAWKQSYPAFCAALLAHAGADGGSASVQVCGVLARGAHGFA